MKYLCLIYQDQETAAAVEATGFQVCVQESLAYADELRAQGRCIDADALMPVSSAQTIRLRGGKVSVVDGPFAETKEQLGGFYLIEAEDMEEAVQLAAKMPPLQVGGCIEVRPLRDLRSLR